MAYDSISAVGGIDPLMLTALQSPNINFRASSPYIAQNDARRVYNPYTVNESIPTSSTVDASSYITAPEEESSNDGWWIGGAFATLLATGACVYAHKRGAGSIIKGFQDIWNSIKGKATKSSPKVFNFLRKGSKNIQEYTINKGGMQFRIKDGDVIEVITRKKTAITDPAKVSEWKRNNQSVVNEVRKLDFTHGLPKGVTLSYTREVTEGSNVYRLTFEDGKLVKAASKDKKGKWVEIADKDLASFTKNHTNIVNNAKTLEKTLANSKVKTIDAAGKVTEKTGTLKIQYRDGQVVGATLDGKALSDTEIKLLKKDFNSEIQKFGREKGGAYGLKMQDYGYVYRQEGGQIIRFDGYKNITSVVSSKEEALTGSNEIKNFFNKNSGIKTEINTITSTGILPEGYRLGTTTLKTKAGNVYTVKGNKISEIKLADGTVLSTKEDIANWTNIAANKYEYDKVVEKVKI